MAATTAAGPRHGQAPSAEGLDGEEAFGQIVTLTGRIAAVLRGYPEGVTVLKELLQNADDAGARVVRVCYDKREHGADQLLYSGLSGFQGPALLAFNDATFSDEDFANITRVGDSSKRLARTKVGRFGVGFNSVYHLTDLPSFVSGEHLVFFDPHMAFLGDAGGAGTGQPGKRIRLTSPQGTKLLGQFPDTFAPFQNAFGCSLRGRFKGTLFRFPLRTKLRAADSRLSSVHYDEASVMGLLTSFEAAMARYLVFLRNIRAIEILVWDAEAQAPRLIARAHVCDPSKRLVRDRSSLSRIPDELASIRPSDTTYNATYRLSVQLEGAHGASKTETYLVAQALGSGQARQLALGKRAKQYAMALLPWGGVAVRIQDDGVPAAVAGQAFVFLPLPCRTGYPLHVNGFFEVSENRRDIWFGRDLRGAGQFCSDWNVALLQDPIATAYAEALKMVAATMDVAACRGLYALFPPVPALAEPWTALSEALGQRLLDAPVIGGSQRWITPRQAVLLQECAAGDGSEAEMQEALCQLGLEAAVCPPAVCQMFPQSTQLTPPMLIEQLRQPKRVSQLETRQLAVLIAYLLRSGVAVSELFGLPILRLHGGQLAVLAARQAGRPVVYFSPRTSSLAALTGLENVIATGLSPSSGGQAGGGLGPDEWALLTSEETNLVELPLADVVALVPSLVHGTPMARAALAPAPTTNPATAPAARPSGFEVCGGSPEAWLRLFWAFAAAWPATDVQGALAPLQGFALVPDHGGALQRLGAGSHGLLDLARLEPGVRALAAALGCADVDQDFVPEALAPAVRHPASPSGLIAALAFASAHHRDRFAALESAERRVLFMHLHSQASNLTQRDLRRLGLLPVWSVCRDSTPQPNPGSDAQGGAGHRGAAHQPPPPPLPLAVRVEASSLAGGGQDWLSPCPLAECLLPGCVLPNSPGEQALAAAVGVPVLGFNDFVLRLAPRAAGLPDALLLEVFEKLVLTRLMAKETSSDAVHALSECPFVATRSGARRAPAALYDPAVPELHSLVDPWAQFPSGGFATEKSLLALRTLGLRSSITLETLLEIAEGVAARLEQPGGIDAALVAGEQLFRYLCSHCDALFNLKPKGLKTRLFRLFDANTARTGKDVDGFFARLGAIRWVPCATASPEEGLPWLDQPAVMAPRDMRPLGERWWCSATNGLLPETLPRPPKFLEQGLGWGRPVPAQTLERQLAALSGAVAGGRLDPALVSRHVPGLYAELGQRAAGPGFAGSCERMSTFPSVWVGTGFVLPARVAVQSSVSLAPYLLTLPRLFAEGPMLQLFRRAGVKQRFGVEDLLGALGRMQEELSAQKGTGSGEPSHGRLSGRQLDLAVAILAQAAEHPDAVRAATRQGGVGVFVPDQHLRLRPCAEVAYSEAYYQPPMSADLVHPKISKHVAQRLGVRSVSAMAVSRAAGEFEPYGQVESLTGRLRGLLETYPDGPSIFKEMIQNADDAGATRVDIFFSEQQFGVKSLLCQEMADWQGPAVYVSNDSVFKDKDFINLSRLAQSGKVEEPDATGRFGCGWNSAYHFTDVPSILSGEHLVFLDPHRKYLPDAAFQSKPGIKIKFTGTRLVEQFPDQFAPFQPPAFGADLSQPYPGTLFRFPLRTKLSASKSEIKPHPYREADVRSLFAAFQAQAGDMLVFLKSVRSVTVTWLRDGDDGSRPQTLYESKVTQCIDLRGGDFGPGHRALMLDDQGVALSHPALVQRLRGLPEPWVGTRRKTIETRAGPAAAAAAKEWLISTCLGGATATQMAAEPEYASLRLVPLASVAALIAPQAADPAPGLVYCGLPLPVRSGLPVQVDGRFEVSSNRRDLWSGSDMTGDGRQRSVWNHTLMEDCVATAYCRLLQNVRALLSGGSETGDVDPQWLGHYYTLLPTLLPDPWARVARAVFARLRDEPCVHTSTGAWLAPADVLLVGEGTDQSLLDTCTEAGLPLADCRPPVAKSLAGHLECVYFGPASVRAALRAGTIGPGKLDALRLHPEALHRFLDHLASDLRQTDEGEFGWGALCGLAVLPLHRGSFCEVQAVCRDPPNHIWVCDAKSLQLAEAATGHVLDGAYRDSALVRLLVARAASSAGAGPGPADGPNVRVLAGLDALFTLLPLVLPPSWTTGAAVDRSEAEAASIGGIPAREWVERVWVFVADTIQGCEGGAARRDALVAELLERGEQCALLPTTAGTFLPIARTWALLGRRGSTPRLEDIVTKIGCCFLEDGAGCSVPPGIASAIQHPFTPEGLAEALAGLVARRPEGPEAFRRLPRADRWDLFEWFSRAERPFSPGFAAALVQLPIVELAPPRPGQAGEFLTVAQAQAGCGLWLPPPFTPAELLDERFVSPRAAQREAFWTACGVKAMPATAFFQADVLPNLAELGTPAREKVCKTVLLRFEDFQREDLAWADSIGDLPIVEAQDGEWYPPHRLCHPDLAAVSGLVAGRGAYPAAGFRNPVMIRAMEALGLRRELDLATFVMCIERLRDGDEETAGRLWAALLEDHSRLLAVPPLPGAAGLHSALQSRAWLPAVTSLDPVYLPTLPGRDQLASSAECRPSSDAWLASASYHLVPALPPLPEPVLQFFGWHHPVPPAHVAQQILAIQLALQELDDDDRLDFATGITAHMADLYLALAAAVEAGAEGMDTARAALSGKAWLWIGSVSDFVEPSRLALSAERGVAAEPYLFTAQDLLPSGGTQAGGAGTSALAPLLTWMGVKDVFAAADYLGVIVQVRDSCAAQNERPLSEDELVLVAALAKQAALEPGTLPAGTVVLLPDSERRLAQATELVFNDALWMGEMHGTGVVFVHESIPSGVAEALGARSLQMLVNSSSDFAKPMACPGLPALQATLAGVETEVEAGRVLSVFADLIDFADGLGCAEIEFALDLNEHGRRSVIHPNLARLQGPALIVRMSRTLPPAHVAHFFNPATVQANNMAAGFPFLREGPASCFALGDCISVLSGQHLSFLDPCGQHLVFEAALDKVAAPGAPTAKTFDFLKSSLLAKFQDQFQPFAAFRFDPAHMTAWDETLVRIPLRTSRGHGIGQRFPRLVFSPAAIQDQLQQLAEADAGTSLVFSRFLRQLDITILPQLGGMDVHAPTQGKAATSDEPSLGPAPPGAATEPLCSVRVRATAEADEGRKVLHRTKSWSAKLSLMGLQYPSVNSSYRIELEVVLRSPTNPGTPAAAKGAASSGTAVQEWVVHQALGNGPACDLALRRNAKPVVGAAALLRHNGSAPPAGTPELQGRFHCGSPCSTGTGARLHINAPFGRVGGALHPRDTAEQEWHLKLILAAAGPAALLLKAISRETAAQEFYAYWPTSSDAGLSTALAPMITPLYKRLSELDVFYLVRGDRVPMHRGAFVTRTVEPTIRTYISNAFDNCMELPADCVKDLQTVDESRGFFSKRTFHELTPKKLRAHVRSRVAGAGALLREATANGVPAEACPQLAAELLAFCAANLPSSQRARKEELAGLSLLPLQTGKVVAVGSVPSVVAGKLERELLNGADGGLTFAHEALHEVCAGHELGDILAPLGITQCSYETVAKSLPRLLPPSLRTEGSAAEPAGLGDWLARFWDYLMLAPPGAASRTAPPPGDSTTPVCHRPELLRRCSLVAKWALIPTAGERLGSIGARELVLCTDDSPVPEEVLAAVVAFGCPRLRAGWGRLAAITGGMPPPPDEAELWATYLAQKLADAGVGREPEDSGQRLDRRAALSVFAYFQEHHEFLADTPQIRAALRALPMFRCMGAATALVAIGRADAFTFDPRLCRGLSVPEADNCLAYDTAHLGLYEFLGVRVLEPVDVYKDLVLARFADLPMEDKCRHIADIKRDWTTLGGALQGPLRSTPCLKNAQGDFVAPPELVVVGDNKLLKAVFGLDPSRTPAQSYSHSSWKPFLRDIGVQDTLTKDITLRCCQVLAERLHHISPEVEKAADLLVRHVNKTMSLHCADQEYQQTIREARFVPARLAFGGHVCLSRFSDCCLARDLELGCAVRPVLDSEHTPPPVFWARLGLQSPPPIPTLLDNIQELDAILQADGWSLEVSLGDVMTKLFAFLDDRTDSMLPAHKQRLSDLACIPIGHRLLPPRQVFLELQQPLGPFVYELPRSCLQYTNLLQVLNVSRLPTSAQLLVILRDLAHTTRGRGLNPSELHAVNRLLRFMATLGDAAGDAISTKAQVWVPDVDGRLVPRQQCVFSDGVHELAGIDVAKAELRLVSPLVARSMCVQLGIRPLSAVIRQAVSLGEEATRRKLHPACAQAIVRLAEQRLVHSRDVDAALVRRRLDALGSFTVVAVATLSVRYLAARTRKPDVDVTADSDGPCFYHCDVDELVVYAASVLPPGVAEADVLALALNKFIALDSSLPIAPLLRQPEHTQQTLRVLHLTPEAGGALSRSIPGARVLPDDLPLLKLNPAREYYDQEIVAWESDDGHLRYGQVLIHKLDDQGSRSSGLARLRVDVGHGQVTVLLSSQVYHFGSPANSSAEQPAEGRDIAAAFDQLAESGFPQPLGQQQTEAQGDAASVPAQEYMRALRLLMEKAELPLPDDAAAGLQSILEAREQVASLTGKLSDASSRLVELEAETETLLKLTTCSICLMGERDGVAVDTALLPCGHMYCGRCAASLRQCASCKGAIAERKRLYR